MPKIIVDASSKRAPIREDQAQLLAKLIRLLEEAAQQGRSEALDDDWFYQLPEYALFAQGASALGFVCRDFSSDGIDLDAIANRPEELADVSLPRLRRYVHALMRNERHNFPNASFVLAAIRGGALAMVARRLESDDRLRASIEIDDDLTD